MKNDHVDVFGTFLDTLRIEEEGRALSTWIARIDANQAALGAEITTLLGSVMLESPDAITLEPLLARIGEAMTRSSGEERRMRVTVEFLS